MLTQMQRRSLELAAEDLVDAMDSSWDTFQVLTTMHRNARTLFKREPGTPDPASILMALQAQALGVKTLAQWCMEVGQVLSIKYHNAGQYMLDKLYQELDALGVVLPS